MVITLCKKNKYNKETKKLLERNLKKVKFEEKGCLGECSACKKGPIAELEGKTFTGKDPYELLKKIKKSNKISDKHFIDKNNEENTIGSNEIKISARIVNDELFIRLPKEVFEMDDLVISFITDDTEIDFEKIAMEKDALDINLLEETEDVILEKLAEKAEIGKVIESEDSQSDNKEDRLKKKSSKSKNK